MLVNRATSSKSSGERGLSSGAPCSKPTGYSLFLVCAHVCVHVRVYVCVCVRACVCLPVACTRPLTFISVCLHAITPTLAVALALSLSLAFALALVCAGVRTSSPGCRKGSERYSIKHKQYLRTKY